MRYSAFQEVANSNSPIRCLRRRRQIGADLIARPALTHEPSQGADRTNAPRWQAGRTSSTFRSDTMLTYDDHVHAKRPLANPVRSVRITSLND